MALRDAGPGIVAGSDRKLSFGGEKAATIAAGAVLFSDPVALGVAPLADLAVTLYLPGEILNDFQITGRYARQTNYISPPGDFTAANVMPIASLTSDWFFVCGVDVLASADTGGIVALGDSLTDGNISTMDAFCRWPDQLARRLMARQRGRPMAVMNQGLGGNRILFDLRGDSGLRRFDRDVLAQPGVTHAHCHARHQRSAQPLEKAGRRAHRGADDRRAQPDGGARPQPRHQDRSAPR